MAPSCPGGAVGRAQKCLRALRARPLPGSGTGATPPGRPRRGCRREEGWRLPSARPEPGHGSSEALACPRAEGADAGGSARGFSLSLPAGAHATSSANSPSSSSWFLFPPPSLFYLSAFHLGSQFLPLLLISPVFPLNRHLTLSSGLLRTLPLPSCYTEQHVATGWVPARAARPARGRPACASPSPPPAAPEASSPSSAADSRSRRSSDAGELPAPVRDAATPRPARSRCLARCPEGLGRKRAHRGGRQAMPRIPPPRAGRRPRGEEPVCACDLLLRGVSRRCSNCSHGFCSRS